MKNSKTWFFLFLIFFYSAAANSQKITTGIYSGVNFSDIHGQDIGGKWKAKPGPVQGFYLGYSFNRTIGIQTGINLSTVYYEHKTLAYPNINYEFTNSPFDRLANPYVNPDNFNMDFRFLRIPLLFTVSVPNTLQFEMHAGIYVSFLNDWNLNNLYYYDNTDKPARHDFGYIFSSGLSYPFNENFKATFSTSYNTGRRKFLNNYLYRHGSSEFTIGVAYTGFNKNKKNVLMPGSESDSSSARISVVIFGGLNYSWNKGSAPIGKYYGCASPSIGFSLKFPVGKGGFFRTGFSFERKGYSIEDSSGSFYRLIKVDNQMYYVDTKVQTDYAIIPGLLSFPVGKARSLFFSTGPWLGLKLNARTVGAAYQDYHSQSGYQVNKTVVYDDIEKLIKGYDLGWIFGCELSVPVLNNYEVNLALQYSIGFRDVFDNSASSVFQSVYDPVHVIKNRTLSLSLGFRIP